MQLIILRAAGSNRCCSSAEECWECVWTLQKSYPTKRGIDELSSQPHLPVVAKSQSQEDAEKLTQSMHRQTDRTILLMPLHRRLPSQSASLIRPSLHLPANPTSCSLINEWTKARWSTDARPQTTNRHAPRPTPDAAQMQDPESPTDKEPDADDEDLNPDFNPRAPQNQPETDTEPECEYEPDGEPVANRPRQRRVYQRCE